MMIVEFLAARLSEEQAMAEEAASGPHDDALARDDFGRLLIRPDRMLAQVAAMRAIVDQYERLDRESDKSDGLADLAAKEADEAGQGASAASRRVESTAPRRARLQF